MGFVICEKHEGQGGALCCDHVANAVYKISDRVKYEILKVEITDSKDDELLHHICKKCISEFELDTRKYVPESIWSNESLFPYVYPVCGICLNEYQQKT